MKQVAQELAEVQPEVFAPLLDRAGPLYTYECYKKCCYVEDKYGFPAALVHSDLWAPNILFETDIDSTVMGKTSAKLAAIIDWQTAHPGNPCEDLGRLLSGNTTGEYRRENTRRLLKYYLQQVESYSGGQAPFNYEQLIQAYNASMGYVLAFMTFSAPMHMKMSIVDGRYPGEYRDELLKRVRMFFEDTLEANFL
uniref:CHK kinase-like domain-containing protein n=1 Tax=Acrobeloides nanus TaxID=290746 RepID=A0A914DT87_9BILA